MERLWMVKFGYQLNDGKRVKRVKKSVLVEAMMPMDALEVFARSEYAKQWDVDVTGVHLQKRYDIVRTDPLEGSGKYYQIGYRYFLGFNEMKEVALIEAEDMELAQAQVIDELREHVDFLKCVSVRVTDVILK